MKSQKIIKKVNGDDLFYFDKHTKTYDEWIAREILMDTYPNEFSDLVVKDIPDLQDEKNEIGVEVTYIKGPLNANYAQNLHNRIKKSKDIEQICTLKGRIERIDAEYIDSGDDITGIGFNAYLENKDMFIETLNMKIDKLNNKDEYERFVYVPMKRYDLFIKMMYFNNSNNTLEKVIDVMKNIQSSKSRKYAYLYVFSEWGKIFKCDLINGEIREKKIERNKLEEYHEVAKKKSLAKIDD